jgi:hypothetical protein
MGLIRDANQLAYRLFAHGSTNNEDLQRLLILLKEISDSRPEVLGDEFLEVFPGLDIDEIKRDGSNIMLMMFLTQMAMMYRPTESSQAFIDARQAEEAIAIKLRESELSVRDYFQSRFT